MDKEKCDEEQGDEMDGPEMRTGMRALGRILEESSPGVEKSAGKSGETGTGKGVGPLKSAASKLGTVLFISMAVIFSGCDKKEAPEKSDEQATEKVAAVTGPSKGVGPIQSVELKPIDEELVKRGEKLFKGTCSACHKLDQRYVGPALNGVTKRRAPEWIMNMILNPAGMTQQDDTARALLGTYMVQMSVNVTPEEARAALEFFRKNDSH